MIYVSIQRSLKTFLETICGPRRDWALHTTNQLLYFLKPHASHLIIVVLYVDDILESGFNIVELFIPKHHLGSTFGIKDLGHSHYFLGFAVTHLHDGISL